MTDAPRVDPAEEASRRGWSYAPIAPPPPIVGAVFGAITGTEVTDHVTVPGEPSFEFGTLRGTVGGTRTEDYDTVTITMTVTTSTEVDYGYLSVQLPRRMPHFVVDAVANDGGRSSLPIRIDRGQRVSLEGDFDSHFALYAPKGYERDALYLFTPDVMALLIDETGDYDVELSDDRLTVYAPTPWDLTDPAVWDRLADLAQVLGGKAARQASRYRDERAAPGEVVAPVGRRLDQGFLGRGGIVRKLLLVAGVGLLLAVAALGVSVFFLLP